MRNLIFIVIFLTISLLLITPIHPAIQNNSMKSINSELSMMHFTFKSFANKVGKSITDEILLMLLVLFIAYYMIVFIVGFYVGFHMGYLKHENFGFFLRILNGFFVGLYIGLVTPFVLIKAFIIEPIIRFLKNPFMNLNKSSLELKS